MTTILLLCVSTWLLFTAIVYWVSEDFKVARAVGFVAAVWVGSILMFIGMAGR